MQSATQSPRATHFERRLLEAFDQLWNNFVDPADAIYDSDGTRWNSVASIPNLSNRTPSAPYADEQQLAEIRSQCRSLAAENEFAINGHEKHFTKLTLFY